MQPSIQTLGKILYSRSQYVIPVFQRNYRWEEQRWKKLWDSLAEIRQPNKNGNHFMGFLVFVPGLPQPAQNTTFHLIDGQQRLTTLSILLAAIRNIARENDQDNIDPIKKGEQCYRLLSEEARPRYLPGYRERQRRTFRKNGGGARLLREPALRNRG